MKVICELCDGENYIINYGTGFCLGFSGHFGEENFV